MRPLLRLHFGRYHESEELCKIQSKLNSNDKKTPLIVIYIERLTLRKLKLEICESGAEDTGQMLPNASNMPVGMKLPAVNTSRGLMSVNNAALSQARIFSRSTTSY